MVHLKPLLFCAVAAASSSVVFPSAASAQTPGGLAACKPEAQRYCSSSIARGRDATIDCLVEHQDDIGDACYKGLKAELERERDSKRSERDPTRRERDSEPVVYRPIYKVKAADGRTVYTNAPPADYVSAEEIAQDRVISVMPIRAPR